MSLRLRIHFATQFGQDIVVQGDFGRDSSNETVELTWEDGGWWRCCIVGAQKAVYAYALREGGRRTLEAGPPRVIDFAQLVATSHAELRDVWRVSR
jgi:hypothetical protein